jgi:DNA-binding beta-propeller fold protein YncE
VAVFAVCAVLACTLAACQRPADAQGSAAAPQYRVEPDWPAPLPQNWILGQVAGIAVDRDDNVWLLQRPRSLTDDEMFAAQRPPEAGCCVPAPAVIQLDPAGEVLQAWGGPRWDPSTRSWSGADPGWPDVEHGIHVDDENNVWVGGNGDQDHVVLKYSRDGERLLTLGRPRETGGSNDTARLGRPAAIAVDVAAREVFVADGYDNRRVIVFDMDSGEYRRHWGAYGDIPNDGPLPEYRPDAEPARQFRGPVHAVRLARDGRVYVADRSSNRIQVFQRNGSYLVEALLAPATIVNGSVWDLALSPDPAERWLFVADGTNRRIWILDRDTLEVAGSFGRGGRQAGQFDWVHNIAIDSAGNVYTAEVNTGKRVQKFFRVTER